MEGYQARLRARRFRQQRPAPSSGPAPGAIVYRRIQQMKKSIPFLILTTLALVFAASTPATVDAAASLLTLHDFAPGTAGSQPVQPVIYGTDGNFYGITYYGGSFGSGQNGQGCIYKMTSAGVVTNLHSFASSATGSNPYGLSQGSDGNLYGVTFSGGSGYYGTIFKISKTGAYTILHNFAGGDTDGAYPQAAPILSNDGNIFGTTSSGGTANDGIVYQLTSGGTFNILHSFTGADGGAPRSQVVRTAQGTIYGTTFAGTGSANLGTFFKIASAGTFTNIHNFTATDGQGPGGRLLPHADGNFYGCCVTAAPDAEGQ